MILGGVIACIFVSVLLSLFSFVIWKKKDLSFVAGYNEQTFGGDKNKLANAVGIFLMISAVLILMLPFALEFIGASAGIIFAVLTLVIPITLVPRSIITSEPVTDIAAMLTAGRMPARKSPSSVRAP